MLLRTEALTCPSVGLPSPWQGRVRRSAHADCKLPRTLAGSGRGSGSAEPSCHTSQRSSLIHFKVHCSTSPGNGGANNAAVTMGYRSLDRSSYGSSDSWQQRQWSRRTSSQSSLVRCTPDASNSSVYSDEKTATPPTSNGAGTAEINGHSGVGGRENPEEAEQPENGAEKGGSSVSEVAASGQGAVGGVDSVGESPVIALRELLRLAQEGLEMARKRSEELEEEAQKVAERGIRLNDEAAEAEQRAAQAMAKVEELGAQEKAAQEALAKAEAAYVLAEEAFAEAEGELGAALRNAAAAEADSSKQTEEPEFEDAEEFRLGPRFGKEKEKQARKAAEKEAPERASVLAWQQAFEQAQADLNAREQELVQAKTEVQKLAALKKEFQQTSADLKGAKAAKRAEADAAEADVALAMELAEKAVGREVEASQRVSDAELALQKGEKLAAELEQAALAAAAAEKAGKLASEVAEVTAALTATAEADELVDRGPEIKSVMSLIDEAAGGLVGAPEPEVEEKETRGVLEADKAVAAMASIEVAPEGAVRSDVGVSDKEAVLEVKGKPAEKDLGEEKEVAPPIKSSPKKSSRFFPASYFSSADDAELSLGDVVTGLFDGIKKQLPKVILAVAVILASGAVINARMEKKLQLQPPVPGASMPDVTQPVKPVKPLIAELQKIPSQIKSAIDMLPHNELNDEETQLFDVLWLLLASVVFVPIFQKLPGGSPVLGYLAAGALIGPYALSIIKHVHGTKALAEFGVVFLMFNIGLELSLERLRSMRKYVFGLGSAQVLLTALAVGLIVTAATGVPGNAALVIGNGLALSSTAVVLQVLQERGESTSKHGRATFSVLLFQDLAVVVLLILIPLLSPESAKGGGGVMAIIEALGLAALKAVVAITGIIAGGRLLLRPIYKRMAENHNAEIFAANTLLVVLGTSVLTARAGLSMALGAFLAGVLLAETEFALQVESDINPYRGLLLGLFFMTVGMSIDPKLLVAKFPLIVGSIALLLIGKTALIAGIGRAFGMSTISSIRAGLLLAPGGEFAFVAFGEAVQKGIMTAQTSSLLFLIVGISMALTPYLAAGGQLLASKFEQQDVRSLQPDETELKVCSGESRGRRKSNAATCISTSISSSGVILNASSNSLDGESVGSAIWRRSSRILPSTKGPKWVSIEAEDLTAESFAPFGDLLNPVEEDEPYGPQDATVHLQKGIPRLYVMRLRNRDLQFERLTHHASVTQTLGALGSQGAPWYLAVARCSIADDLGQSGLVHTRAGHSYIPPTLEDVRVFRIVGSQMVNLHVGTWHQGPFFGPPAMDFYNLELSNTGEVDHSCHAFGGIKVEILDPKYR